MQKRSIIFPAERLLFSSQAKRIFHESELFSYEKFALYAATQNEFDCEFLAALLWENKKEVFLPLLQNKNEALRFACYKLDTTMILNRYKILEPENPEFIPTEELDVVFVPLVAFDLLGNRVGMGAGYYDRTFHFLKENTVKKPLLIGLGYTFQLVENLPSDKWDVKLNGVLTEKELILFS